MNPRPRKPSSFVDRHGLWTSAQAKAAAEVEKIIKKEKLEVVRFSFADQHGVLRGKTLLASEAPSAMRAGVTMTTTLLAKDTAHRTVYPVFTPGGGFAGGLTAGLALVLRYLAGGRYELGETLPLDAGKILGVGLGLSAGTAAASLLVGAPVLSSALIQIDVPVLGTVKFVTALFFDLGVYMIVVGLVLDVLRSLGARVDVDLSQQQTAVASR